MQNFDLYKFGIDNFRPSDGCNLHYRKFEIVQRTMFSNVVKIMIFISDVSYYIL